MSGQAIGLIEEYATVGPLVRFVHVLLFTVDEEGWRWTVVIVDGGDKQDGAVVTAVRQGLVQIGGGEGQQYDADLY